MIRLLTIYAQIILIRSFQGWLYFLAWLMDLGYRFTMWLNRWRHYLLGVVFRVGRFLLEWASRSHSLAVAPWEPDADCEMFERGYGGPRSKGPHPPLTDWTDDPEGRAGSPFTEPE